MQKTLERILRNPTDSYAKFGEANQNVQTEQYLLLFRLDTSPTNNPSAAKNDFTQALQLYPGNIWAQLMNKDIH